MVSQNSIPFKLEVTNCVLKFKIFSTKLSNLIQYILKMEVTNCDLHF